MPRYFFTVADGRVFTDEIGVVLPGIPEARAHAIQTAGSMLADESLKGWQGTEWRITVTDQTAKTILRLRFSAETVHPIGGRLAAIDPRLDFDRDRLTTKEEETFLTSFRMIDDDEVRTSLLDHMRKLTESEDPWTMQDRFGGFVVS